MLQLDLLTSGISFKQLHLCVVVLFKISAQSLNFDLNNAAAFLQASKESIVRFPGKSGTVQEERIVSSHFPRVFNVSAINIS